VSRLTWATLWVFVLPFLVILWALNRSGPELFYDGRAYFQAASAILAGHSPYLPIGALVNFPVPGAYIYPPTLALGLAAVSWIGTWGLTTVWDLLCFVSPFLALVVGFRAGGGTRKQLPALILLTGLLSLFLTTSALEGNASAPLALLGGLTLLCPDEVLGGLAAGLATAIKLLSAPVSLLLAARSSRGLIGGLIIGLLCLATVPFFPQLWYDAFQTTLAQISLHPANPTFHNAAPSVAIGYPQWFSDLAVVGLTLLALRFRRSRFLFAWSVATSASLLLSPEIWGIYLAALLPAFGYLATRSLRWPILPFLAAIFLSVGHLTTLTSSWPWPIYVGVLILLAATWQAESSSATGDPKIPMPR
jgi:hypothetical protein